MRQSMVGGLLFAAVIAGGCAGTVPHCKAALNAEQRAEVARLAEYIGEVGERWQQYAKCVAILLEAGDICIGRTRGHLGWAWHGLLPDRIILPTAFFSGGYVEEDLASVLVIEAAHIVHKKKNIYHLQAEFLNDVYATTEEVLP